MFPLHRTIADELVSPLFHRYVKGLVPLDTVTVAPPSHILLLLLMHFVMVPVMVLLTLLSLAVLPLTALHGATQLHPKMFPGFVAELTMLMSLMLMDV